MSFRICGDRIGGSEREMEVQIFISDGVDVLTFLVVNQWGTGHSSTKTLANVGYI